MKAMAVRCTEAYRALVASKAGAMRQWEHDGTVAVVKERRGCNARQSGRQGNSGTALRCAALLWAEERAKEEAREENESAWE